MKRRDVDTNVKHPTAVAIMEEIDGKPVRRVFQHDATTEPHSATYKVNFLAVEV